LRFLSGSGVAGTIPSVYRDFVGPRKSRLDTCTGRFLDGIRVRFSSRGSHYGDCFELLGYVIIQCWFCDRALYGRLLLCEREKTQGIKKNYIVVVYLVFVTVDARKTC